MSADVLLSRLDGVKKTGMGKWIARCPSHDSHSGASLAIRELDDGRTLLHDFGGCAVEDVLAAVGLDFDALYPERAIDHHVKAERRPFFPSDIFKIALREITICSVIACDLHAQRTVSDAGYERLLTACGRLNNIAEVAYGK